MNRRALLPFAVVVLGALLVTSLALAQPPKPKVRIVKPVVALSFANLTVALGKGFFEQEGVSVEVITTAGGGSEIQAVLGRNAELAVPAGTELLKTHTAGAPLLGVMNMFDRLIINILVSKQVATRAGITATTPLDQKIKVLKGLNIGITRPGALTDLLVRYYLLRAGLNPERDAQIVAVGSPTANLAALQQGKVDAMTGAPPNSNHAVVRGFGVMLVDQLAGEDPDFAEFLMQVLVARPDWARENGDTLRRVVRAISRGSQWIRESTPEQVREVLAPEFPGLDREVILAAIKALQPGFVIGGAFTEKSFTNLYVLLEKTGIASGPRVPWRATVTNDYVAR
jgi:NitT/TauT family transport system substrate-binding protein